MDTNIKTLYSNKPILTLPILLISALLLLFSSISTIASPSLSDYGMLPTIQNMAISPSGDRIAYRKVDQDGDKVIVYSFKDKKVVIAIDVSQNIPRYIFFVDEEKLILKVSDRDRIDGFVGEYEISAAYIYNIRKKSLKLLLAPGKLVYQGQTRLGNIIGVSPDKEQVYMTAWSGERLSSQAKAMRKNALLRVKMTRPRNPHYHANGSTDSINYFLDGDGEALVEERYNQASNMHTILVKKNGDWSEIYTTEEDVRTLDPVGVTADFQNLVVRKYNIDTDRLDLYFMSLADGSLALSDMSKRDLDVEDVITDINSVVYGVAYAGFTRKYNLIDKQQDKRLKTILELFPDHTVLLKSWSDDWQDLIVYAEGPNYPGDFYLFSAGKPPEFITTARPHIAPEDIHPIASLTFSSRDGLKIPVILTIPKQKIENIKDLPAVIFPHGGPESYDRFAFDYLAQAMASHGYLVIQPQFRGSLGFGLSFRNAGHGEWGRKMQDDLTDSLKFMLGKGFVDPKRVCIVGMSYGGYAALAGGAFTPDLYSCVVSINGLSDINRLLSSGEYRYGSNHWVVSYWQELLANGEVDSKQLRQISPIKFAKQFQAPTLLISSENDEVVRPYQSETMYDALRSNDKVAKLVELENENHYLETNQGRLKALGEVMAFLTIHLGSKN